MTERERAFSQLVIDMVRLAPPKIVEALHEWKPDQGPVITVRFQLMEETIREALDPNYRTPK